MKIIVSEEIETVCPKFVGACVEANVQNSPYCQELWDEINALGEKYRDTLTTESLKEMSGIAATRKVYRACGKDPSRYRPASEALIRRMLQGKQLYQTRSSTWSTLPASHSVTASEDLMPTSLRAIH